MDLVTRNVLKHVYDAILSRKRMADNGNISNLQLFYNRLISEYCASDKKGQCLVVPLTGQDVDDFYSRKMKRENFVEIIRTKVIAKVPHFDSAVLHKLCWECFSGSHDAQLMQLLTLVSQSSATLLWLIFCKLDTDSRLKLHPEDVIELMVRLLMHLRVTPDRKTLETWLGDQMGNLAAWVSFWPFFIVLVEKCLGPRGAQATSRAVQALYDEIVEEVMKKAQMIKKGHVRHTWKMRWFVLTSTDLFYYETKESLVKKGSVVLNERARVEVMMDKNEKDTRYPNRFKVVDGISSQFTEISADTLAQMNEWVDAINMAIKLNSISEARNYVHKLQLVQRGDDNVSDSQPSSVKSPVMQSFSAQPTSLPSMDDVSELSSGSSNSKNKISRKISLPVLSTSPPPVVESRETVSANSSQTDLYAVVDKKKKISAPNVPPVSTRPVRKHDYEDINDEDLPAPPPQYHAPPMSTRPFRRHDYEDIPDENLPPLPPHHHTDVKPNGNVPPKIPAPYHSSSNSTELKVSSANKKMANLHSSSFDTSTDPLGTRDDEVIRRLKPAQSADGPQKRHSSIIDEEDFNRTYSTISDEKPDIRRSHTPDIGSLNITSVDKRGVGKVPEIPSRRKISPPTVPKRGSPLAQKRQLAVDPPTPPLPPKKQPSVEYSEVPVNRPTTLGMANGIAGVTINEDRDYSSYADLDFSQLPTPTGGPSAPPPVDHSKRDYADIDFVTTIKLEKSILHDDGANTSHVTLPPKLPSKNMGSVEDKSGYVKVDFKSNGDDRSGQPKQMMVIQPQQSTPARMSPIPTKTMSTDVPPTRPKPTPRSQNSAPLIPPHHSKNPPPLPPKQPPY